MKHRYIMLCLGSAARFVAIFLLAAFSTFACTLPVAGQERSQVRRSYDQALARLLAAPGNPEASFEFAQAAVNASDPRAAIAALERILIFNPKLANIRLELGSLYLVVGATRLAQRRLQEALASPEIPPEVKARAEQLLAQTERANEPLRYSGSAYLGVQGASNASAAPGSTTVQIVSGGSEIAAQLDSSATAAGDAAAVALLTGTVEYDLGYQRNHKIIAEAFYYGTRWSSRSDINVDAFDVTIGPELSLNDRNTFSVRPFVTGSYVRQDNTGFLQTAGIGIDAFRYFDSEFSGRIRFLVLHQDFIQSVKEPTNNNRDGTAISVRPAIDWVTSPTRRVSLGVEARHSGAKVGFEQFNDVGPFISILQLLPSALGGGDPPWLAYFNAGYRYRHYDRRDPTISLTEEQVDHRLDARLGLRVPVATALTLAAEIGYTRNYSNYAIDTFSNVFGSVGLEYRF